jgi:hypothetical protein
MACPACCYSMEDCPDCGQCSCDCWCDEGGPPCPWCGEPGCPGYCDDYQTYNLRPGETGGLRK